MKVPLTVLLLLAGAAQAADGQALWNHEVIAANGSSRSCATCHGSDPRQTGKHVRTGKYIAPMAPAVEPQRFSDPAKTEKWFLRNCKWTWGRACTAEEKQQLKAWLYTF